MAPQLRQAPLLDRDQDKALFVSPEGFERATWSVKQAFNVLILGDRGQGKTSVLHQLELDLRREQPARNIAFVDLARADSVEVALRLLVSGAADATGELLAWTPPLPRPNEPEEERNIRASLNQL